MSEYQYYEFVALDELRFPPKFRLPNGGVECRS
ncbi:hypothetical protein Thivi_3280 [Thiocystis violascens DSM 198]|uniref:Uncharacterized protein n=1 Tax=Thiocystis violascens (strain ATCC 17096 / DSM 198 / 6111) TaxID=765911 RepID=I3YDT6_THIV6|nr:hypothetical protein Thivi_3280 [Thiocystis violascens DSM 198]